MQKEGICGVDLGTSHIKAGLIDARGDIGAFVERSVPPLTATIAMLAFDAEDYLAVTWDAIHALLHQPAARDWTIHGVAITNQRATLVPVGADGRASGPAISWQDTQGSTCMHRFMHGFGQARYIQITGLPPSALWTLAKLLWLREAYPALYQASARFVLLHDYLLARLGAEEFVTDPSNASLTGLLDVRARTWSTEILAAIDLPSAVLPLVRPPGTVAGVVSREAAERTGLRAGTPLLVGGGDQQCGALGIGAVHPGQAGMILGTAAVISCPMNHPVIDEAGRLFCTVHVVPERWVIEGIQNSFGSAVHWWAEQIGVDTPEALDALASTASPGAEGVCFYPYLAGIGSPDFAADVRGAFLGLSLTTRPADLARAVLEGTTLELRRILATITPYVDIRQYVVAGGGAMRPWRVQLLADVLGHAIAVNPVAEATLLGVAICAWTGLGRFATLEDGVRCFTHAGIGTLAPRLPDDVRQRLWARYLRGVSCIRQFHAQSGDGA